jgi:hypothetical protein
VALWAVGAFLAVSVQSERPADKGTWRHLGVSVVAMGVSTVAFGKVQTCRGPFRS